MFKILKILSVKNKKLVIISLGLLILMTLFEILVFTSLQQVLNFFSNTQTISKFSTFLSFIDSDNIMLLIIVFFLVFIIRSITAVIFSLTRNKLVKNVNDEISEKIYDNYLNKNFSFFLNTNSSKLVSNIIVEVEKFSYRVIDPLIYFFGEIFITVGIFLYLATNFFEGTILMTSLIFLSYMFFYKTYVSYFQNLGLIKTNADAKKIDDLQKSFYIINEIKIGKLEKYFRDIFKTNTQNSSRSQFSLNFFQDVPKSLIEIIALLFISGLLYFSYFWLGYNKQEILLMSGIFAVALFRLLPSANRIYHTLNSIKYHLPSIEIIYSELNKEYKKEQKNSEIKSDIVQKLIDFKKIELKDVSYSYNEKNIILEKINLKIKKGNLIGIYGDSGSGKSTLLNLICGLLEPTKGQILCNDINIYEYKKSYYDLLGYVSQNIFLTDDTLKKNIVMGNNVFKKDVFRDAIKSANLIETFNLLSEKENTILGERGSMLSGGQKQRVGIARALYKRSKILILDEPTSALDVTSQGEILNTIMSLKGRVTTLLVTHDMDIIEKCDEVYKIEKKKIIRENNPSKTGTSFI